MTAPELEVYQFHLGDLTHGANCDFENDADGWEGLGLPAFKGQDVDLDGQDGDYLGRVFYASLVLRFPVVWKGTPEEVMGGLLDLRETWARTSETVPLYMCLPGWGLFHVNGQPRGLTADLSWMPSGRGAALLAFKAGDPTIHFDPPEDP